MDSLADSLALVLPDVPQALVPALTRARISRLAGSLAPIHCAGFEVRLTGADRPVDFAQRIVAVDGEPTRLADHIEASRLSPAEPTWTNLAAFAREWARPASVIGDEIAGAWLEFDARGESDEEPRAHRGLSTRHPAPSLFVSLRAPVERGEARRLLHVLHSLLHLFAGAPPSQRLETLLTRCVDSCPAGSGVTDLGLMLGRSLAGVRLAAAPFAAWEVGAFLRRLDWPGGATDLAAAPAGDVDAVTLSFDVDGESPAILPRVGVEYFPGPYLDDLPYWRHFLTALAAHGLCTEADRRALLSWPGYTIPTSDGPNWPAALVTESLLRSPRDFSVIGRRLNHVKVTCTPGGSPGAKAYFGFGPLWLRPGASGGSKGTGGIEEACVGDRTRGSANPQRAAAPADSCTAASLQEGLRAAVDFLLEARSTDGFWCDFATVMGGSDEWVTAYVATELAALHDDAARGAARAAWEWLQARRGPDQGWGFNRDLPHDADATTWGLALAHALGEDEAPRARKAREVLDRHLSAEGGLASYLPEASAELAERLGDAPTAGLFAPHVCVTAAAHCIPPRHPMIARFLRRRQLADGRWLAYWWCDDEYATGLAGLGLGRHTAPIAGQDRGGPPSGEDRVAATRAAAWSLSRVRRDGSVVSRYSGEASPFATGSGVVAMLSKGLPEDLARQCGGAVHKAVRWLLSTRRPDGSWAPSALMRIPVGARSPSGDACAAFVGADSARLFSTATVLRALRLSRGLFR